MKNRSAETYLSASPEAPSESPLKRNDALEGDDEALEELRQLLLKPELEAIRKLQERLDDPKKRAHDVSRVLPAALALCSSQNAILARELTPRMDKLINASISKNSKIFIKTLSRMIGPATRSALAEKIQGMNRALADSFSLRGLRWRWEAFRTGKTFAEVVMLHSLIYRVEQVFLIHKETGLLLQNVVAKDVVSHDADLVSGMLTAIQDFVKDSFKTSSDEGLETLQVGELSVWIEEGPQMLLAAVIRGQASQELRTILRDALESIYLEKTEALENFQGDNAPFEEIKPFLEICLESRYKSQSGKRAPYFWILFTLLCIAIGVWAFFIWRDHQQWTRYLDKLRKQPGIVITLAEKKGNAYMISGLRDALAPEPRKFLGEIDLGRQKIIMDWKPYYAMDPSFILKRSQQLLQPPQSVKLTYAKGALTAKGAAPHQWLADARILARAIPGVYQFWGDQVVDADLKQLNHIKQQLEIRKFYFKLNETEFSAVNKDDLSNLLADVQRVIRLAEKVNQDIHIQIKGHTDSSGTEKKNSDLSLKRAKFIRAYLIRNGVAPDKLSAIGVGAAESEREEKTDEDRRFNRRVTFQVFAKAPAPEK